jgi:hypothetical protein
VRIVFANGRDPVPSGISKMKRAKLRGLQRNAAVVLANVSPRNVFAAGS